MNENEEDDDQRLARSYRRAGFGFGAGAILWAAGIVITGRLEETNARWLIPIGCAAMSIYFFSLYAKLKE